jgi:hypothetical protein
MHRERRLAHPGRHPGDSARADPLEDLSARRNAPSGRYRPPVTGDGAAMPPHRTDNLRLVPADHTGTSSIRRQCTIFSRDSGILIRALFSVRFSWVIGAKGRKRMLR